MPGQRERETDRLVSNLELKEERIEELDRLVRGVQVVLDDRERVRRPTQSSSLHRARFLTRARYRSQIKESLGRSLDVHATPTSCPNISSPASPPVYLLSGDNRCTSASSNHVRFTQANHPPVDYQDRLSQTASRRRPRPP
jgi:hypothetical protein